MFEIQKQIGKIGEDIVENYYTLLGYEVYKLPTRDQINQHYDFLVTKEDTKLKIEVKYDRSLDREGEACFETKVYFGDDYWLPRPGWTQLYSTLSNILIYYVLPSKKQFLIIPAKKLKSIEFRQFRSVSKDININCSMTAHYIPLTYLETFGTYLNYELDHSA